MSSITLDDLIRIQQFAAMIHLNSMRDSEREAEAADILKIVNPLITQEARLANIKKKKSS